MKINGLDMQKDIVRYDVDFNNVTGLKKCHYLVVDDLKCEDNCIIQDVDVKEWFAQAVFLIGNHTIHGKVTLKNSVFHTDIKYEFFRLFLIKILKTLFFIFQGQWASE